MRQKEVEMLVFEYTTQGKAGSEMVLPFFIGFN